MKKKLYFLLIIAFITFALMGIQRYNDNIETQNMKQCFAYRRVVMGAIEMSSTRSSDLYERIVKNPESGNDLYKNMCRSGGTYSFIVTKDGLALDCSKHGLVQALENDE